MLFGCPQKLRVWQEALTKYVNDRIWNCGDIELLFYGNHTAIAPVENIAAVTLLGTIIFTIWKYHFNWIVDEEVFVPQQVLGAIDIAVQRLITERMTQNRALQGEQAPVALNEQSTTEDVNFPTYYPIDLFFSVYYYLVCTNGFFVK
jgi:hypothetical protein